MKKILRGPSVFITKCNVCDTEFEYQFSDCVDINLSNGSSSLYVICPGCNNPIPHSNAVKTQTLNRLVTESFY